MYDEMLDLPAYSFKVSDGRQDAFAWEGAAASLTPHEPVRVYPPHLACCKVGENVWQVQS